ncbi:hypothetical protein TBR22_A42290 [Luteitalea sp. TBR-22]|nr:hypothetical protein TBR22_A42290 [Luteitalea sp. TBR-22]
MPNVVGPIACTLASHGAWLLKIVYDAACALAAEQRNTAPASTDVTNFDEPIANFLMNTSSPLVAKCHGHSEQGLGLGGFEGGLPAPVRLKVFALNVLWGTERAVASQVTQGETRLVAADAKCRVKGRSQTGPFG